MAAITGLAVLAEPLIRLVYGQKWINAAAPFALLNLTSVVLISITLTWEVFVACGETSRQARFEFVRTAVGTTIFCDRLFDKPESGCGGTGRGCAVSMFLYRPHLDRMTDSSLRDTGPVYLRSGLLTALAVAPAVVPVTTTASSAITVLQIGAAVVPGMVLWAARWCCSPLAVPGRSAVREALPPSAAGGGARYRLRISGPKHFRG